METLGETLRKKRMEKNISLQQVARDTYIAQRYLEALEAEDFQAFTAGAYILGFLRIYSEYLGLSSEAIIEQYSQVMMQERPAPVTDLWEQKSKPNLSARKWLYILIGILLLGITSALVFWFYRDGRTGTSNPAEQTEQPQQTEQTEQAVPEHSTGNNFQNISIPDFELIGLIEQEFNIEQTLNLQIKNTIHSFSFKEVDAALKMILNDKIISLPLNTEIPIDIDKDEVDDIVLTVRSFNRDTRSIIMRISKSLQLPNDSPASPPQRILQQQEGIVTVLDRSQTLRPFSISIAFTSPSFFRAVHSRERVEQVMKAGDRYADDLQAVDIAIANASAATIHVNDKKLPLNTKDNILVLKLAWKQTGNSFQLEAMEFN